MVIFYKAFLIFYIMKISSVNYRSMLKKFRQISKICFAEGKLNFSSITHNLGDY